MYVKVLLGYRDGARQPGNGADAPLFGNMVSHAVQRMDTLELRPYDFPLSARQSNNTTRVLARLWRPLFSGVMQIEMAYTGLELVERGGRRFWFAQRWLCEPTSYAWIKKELEDRRARSR
ncbi:hypothetical protein FN976_26195 [Caenimonas sedimenti]|uniref:Uncharacterized protein n=1 Tax=Caenimonas sedimenti TaxID=2596921 RepID=A0A562ZGD7_9BURK|nr:hypothetical protein [Caenimonas sedimenti]TWO67026.1 hypothetical protein FN976_26195 [Caenimonas sedimenti]